MLLLEDVNDMPMLSDRIHIHWRDYFEAWRILYISELCDSWPVEPLLSLCLTEHSRRRDLCVQS